MLHFVLVPGWWLGGWAWDAVAAELRRDGHHVAAVTLPGLGSADEDRSVVHMEDHISAIVEALTAAPEPVVLVLHSGAGVSGYAATDRVPNSVAAVVYVDTGPGTGAPMWESFEGVEYPLPSWPDLVEDGNSLEGLNDHALSEFRRRALPQPGHVLREGFELTNPARLAIPSTVLCNSMTVEQTKGWVAAGEAFVAELANLTGPIEWIDMPTGHWPMWSRPVDLAAELVSAGERALKDGS